MKKKILKGPWTRTRNRSYVYTFTGHYKNVLLNKTTGVSVIEHDFDTVVLVPQTITMTDLVTPGFATLRDRGGIVNSPMSQASTIFTNGLSGTEVVDETSSAKRTITNARMYFGVPSHLQHSVNIPNLTSYATTAALAGMKSSPMQGFVALAEGKKTADMLLNPLSAMNDLLSYVSRQRAGNKNLRIHNKGNSIVINGRSFSRNKMTRNWGGPGKVVTPNNTNVVIPAGAAISGTILANNLGLRPLMMDLDALLKEIPKLHTEDRRTSRSTMSDSSTVSSTYVRGTAGAETVNVIKTTTTAVKVRVSIMYADEFNVAQDFGMSISDLPLATWELIPSSFLVDYVLNVGDLLTASQQLSTRKILAMNTVTTIDTVTTATYSGYKYYGYVTVKDVSGTDQLTSSTKVRSTEIENPMIAYKPVKQILGPTVIQNVLSLIAQKLASLGKPVKRVFY